MFLSFHQKIYLFFKNRFWSLAIKETYQILSDKRLIFLFIVLPTIQLLIYGSAISPDVHNLNMGIVDYAKTSSSRELISALTENHTFNLASLNDSEQILNQQMETGKVSVGLVIPPEFDRDLSREGITKVQVFVDAVNANTAGIVRSYITQIINHYGQQINSSFVSAQVQPQITFLYNPGLISSWFFLSGIMGVILNLVGSIVSSAAMVREKEAGTLEQLLMTPAANWEILLAKLFPLTVLLLGDVCLVLGLARLIFGLPVRSNVFLFLTLSGLYVLNALGIGILIGTVFSTQQQTQLISFAVNVPLGLLSGTITPIESMPSLFQYLSLLNPLRHYVLIVRGLLLKGVNLDVLWPNAISLLFFAVLLLLISIHKFRTQLNSKAV
ncbi:MULTISPECIES: ABC transporter permease [unclassified Nostoc]|uniref:ABC transporter permease n=1 Tax=unclassified Nostoc TaxID=2593658 RepID=UPI002AD3486C|nr:MULTISPECIES: ABC transporter permease [unclassified Nostoc]MDZ8120929.1 ABC transporter permease [Nostoc sp. CmiVER01]MDZ8226288.1 ABC transporter permease [Nostoc sp. ChiVER01]